MALLLRSTKSVPSSDDRPPDMFRRDRPVDPNFDPSEHLFFRIPPDAVVVGVDPVDIRFPEFSVNRGKFGYYWYLLYPKFFEFGVVEFLVSDIPTPLQSEGGVEYAFRPEHVPDDDNYAHSEVRTFKGKTRSQKSNLPQGIKKEFREALVQRMILIHDPRDPNPF